MDYQNFKEDILEVINAYLGVFLKNVLSQDCIDFQITPESGNTLRFLGIWKNTGRCFSNLISLKLTDSGTVLLMITDSDGTMKHIHIAKEFRTFSELFYFLEQDSFLKKGFRMNQQESA